VLRGQCLCHVTGCPTGPVGASFWWVLLLFPLDSPASTMSNLEEIADALPNITLTRANAPVTGNRDAGLAFLEMEGEVADITYYAEWLRVNVPRLKRLHDNDNCMASVMVPIQTIADVYAVICTTTMSLRCRVFLEAFVRFLMAMRDYACVDVRSEATPQGAGYNFYPAPFDTTGKMVYLVTNAAGRVLDRNDKTTCWVVRQGPDGGMGMDMEFDENRPRLVFNM
jgi:hypothetical protein